MTCDRQDLGLGLSLGFHHQNQQPNYHDFQLNLMPSEAPAVGNPLQPSWNEAFFPSDLNSESCRAVEQKIFLRGIDVNRLPSTVDCEEAGVSSPNSTVSSVSGKRCERESLGDDQDAERTSSRGISDEDDGDNSRKKLRLTKDQSAILEESFKEHNTLNPKQKTALAKQLGLRPRQVEVWFQNRRARTKLKQTEVDCEYLKRCCENLTEENRRLQKEVHELRALKLSPQFYMHMTPPTTLTICPSCERIGPPPNAEHIRAHKMGPRPASISPWATSAAHIANRPFDELRPRS